MFNLPLAKLKGKQDGKESRRTQLDMFPGDGIACVST